MTSELLGPTPANAHEAPWIPDDKTFGARLAMIRQQMGWGNVKEAAIACGIAVESWRTWERDNVRPRDKEAVAQRISERTGVDYGWLLAGQILAGRATQTSSRKFADEEFADSPIDAAARLPSLSLDPRPMPLARIKDRVIDAQLIDSNAA